MVEISNFLPIVGGVLGCYFNSQFTTPLNKSKKHLFSRYRNNRIVKRSGIRSRIGDYLRSISVEKPRQILTDFLTKPFVQFLMRSIVKPFK
jgi:hypothetical protein